MKLSPKNWVIRIGPDQVKGPYSTDAVIKMITSGAFAGTEEICGYPEGSWTALTKQPEFYEALLESLENPVEVDQKKAQKMEAETVISKVETKEVKNLTSEQENNNQLSEQLKSLLDLNKNEVLKEKKPKKIQDLSTTPFVKSFPTSAPVRQTESVDPLASSSGSAHLTISMSDMNSIQKKEIKKLLPIVIGLIVILLGALLYLWPEKNSAVRGWVLIAPDKKQEPVTAEEAKDFKKRLVRAIQYGHFEQILISQSQMVRVIQTNPRDLEAMGLLCMAYELLWPFTKQTVQDLKSISVVTQMARAVNPISQYSDSCQVVYLSAKGQNKEARSLLEKTLDSPVDEKFSLGPFLYYMKGEVFEYEHNVLNAAAYYEQATQLWPQWALAQFALGRMNFKSEKFPESRINFQNIYNQDKESKMALYGLAVIEYKAYKNQEKAYSYFKAAYDKSNVLQKDFQVEAMYYFAQLLVEKNDRKLALEVAQVGYHLNPSHRGLKEIVLSLGGDDKVENAQNEIILLGDQFARVGDHLAAQAQFKAAFDVDPTNATAAFKAAKSLWAINQTKDAISWLTKAIDVDPKMIAAYILKADYQAQKYNFAEAAKTLQQALKKNPQSHEVMKGQALLEFRKNNTLGAIQYGERAIKIYDADVELLTLLAQAHTEFYLNAPGTRKEDLERKEQSLIQAQRYSGKAIDLEPSWPEAQITYAKFLAAKDGPMRGEKYLNDLIKSFPYTIEYRIALAEYHMQNEKYSDAANMYLQVVGLEPKNKKATFGLAEAYRIMNKPDLAQRFYNATSMLDPSDVEPLFSNAKLLIETASGIEARSKILQALAKLKVVKEINPFFPRVSFMLAKCYMELGDFQQALDFVKEEKSKNPNLVDPYLLTAEIFNRKEQFKECAAEYSMAIKMRPSSAELYVKAAICYRKSDAIDIAEDMLTIAKQKESGYSEIYREQGYIFEKKGLFAQAQQAFEKYLDLSPNAPDRAIIEAKLK